MNTDDFPTISAQDARPPFVKLVAEDEKSRPRRIRVRILDSAANRLVAYPSGRVRYFASEQAADEWISAQTRKPARKAFRPRNYTREP